MAVKGPIAGAIAGSGAGILAALAGLLVWKSREWIVPKRVVPAVPGGAGIEEVRFSSADGTSLYGWLTVGEPGSSLIICCHGYGAGLFELAPFAASLAEHGFSTLVFDFRACGRSGGRYTTIGYFEVDDLIAAVDFASARLAGARIGVYGISMGGSVAIMAASRDSRIEAVVSDCAFATLEAMVAWRGRDYRGLRQVVFVLSRHVASALSRGSVTKVRPVDEIELIEPRHILLVHSACDTAVPVEHFNWLSERIAPEAERWLIEDCEHVMGRVDRADEYLERVTGFFARTLRGGLLQQPG